MMKGSTRRPDEAGPGHLGQPSAPRRNWRRSRSRASPAPAREGHDDVQERRHAPVSIDASLLADDKDMLEDLVAAAFNDAVRRAEAVSAEKMGKLTAGMPLPPGMKLPF